MAPSSESFRLEDEIETLRSRREMLEIDSASYSNTTLSKWKARLEFARKQREESELRNQRLVDDAREMSSDYRNRARVAQTSEHAFGYEIAVKEYLKRVRKILPEWVRSIQTSEHGRLGAPKKTYTSLTPRRKESSNSALKQRKASEKEASPLSKPREEQRNFSPVVFQPSPVKHVQPSPRTHFSPKLEDEATAQCEDDHNDGTEDDSTPPPSPAFLPVQTSTFTSMVPKSDGPGTAMRQTPERDLAIPDVSMSEEDVQVSSSPRSSTSPYQSQTTQVAPDNVTPEKSNSSYEPPKSSAKAGGIWESNTTTPIRVKFSAEALNYEKEDSQDTMDSYSYTDSPQHVSPVTQKNSQSQVYYSESEEVSPASVSQIRSERSVGGAGGADRRREESPLRTPVKLSVDLPQTTSTSQGKEKSVGAALPLANEEEEITRRGEQEKVARLEKRKAKGMNKSSPAAQARSRNTTPKTTTNSPPPTHQATKTASKKSPKVTTFANRTFDTDSEDSDVYPSYQSKRPSNENSDEFDF